MKEVNYVYVKKKQESKVILHFVFVQNWIFLRQ